MRCKRCGGLMRLDSYEELRCLNCGRGVGESDAALQPVKTFGPVGRACQQCGQDLHAHSPKRRFCERCLAARDQARKRRYTAHRRDAVPAGQPCQAAGCDRPARVSMPAGLLVCWRHSKR